MPIGLTDVIVPASFNFPHTGKLLSLSFILFAGWFADAAVPVSAYPQLALAGLVSFFGSLTAAVPFLLDLLRIPADTFQLFLATGVINSRVGSLLAAVHTLTVALLATCAITGHLRWRRRRVMSYAGSYRGAGGRRYWAARARCLPRRLSPAYSKDAVLASMQLLHDPVEATLATTPSPAPPTALPPLEAIAARGVLRVGYLPDALPFAFVNQAGDLVGFDIELAHHLARELGVTLAFVPLDRDSMAAQLDAGYCDLVMSGVAVTTERARDAVTVRLVSRRDDRIRGAGSSTRSLRDLGSDPRARRLDDRSARCAVLHAQAPRSAAGRHHHHAARRRGVVRRRTIGADAFALQAERGSAWTLRYPAYSVVVPGPDPIRVPLAYPIGKRDAALARVVNTWIALKRKDGTLDAAYQHWILGHDATPVAAAMVDHP